MRLFVTVTKKGRCVKSGIRRVWHGTRNLIQNKSDILDIVNLPFLQ